MLYQHRYAGGARKWYLGENVRAHYAVARQQVASYIFQSPKGYRSLEKVQSLIDECVPSQPLRGLLDTMVNEGELLSDHGRIKLDDTG